MTQGRKSACEKCHERKEDCRRTTEIISGISDEMNMSFLWYDRFAL